MCIAKQGKPRPDQLTETAPISLVVSPAACSDWFGSDWFDYQPEQATGLSTNETADKIGRNLLKIINETYPFFYNSACSAIYIYDNNNYFVSFTNFYFSCQGY